ncbi:MAG: EamA family transporter [Beijerinckiaceae bacterium]|nr:EamA family transporter [Beijerinckiaceae bacterium]
MKRGHLLLGLLVAAIWGFNFVVIHWALESYPPLLLAALRFAVAAVAVAILPRPDIPWRWLIAMGLVWFTGQFAFLFVGMWLGVPGGLASVIMQVQAFLTVIFAVAFIGETLTRQQLVGCIVAGSGLIVIGSTAGVDIGGMTPLGLASLLAGATCWAVGNIMVKKTGKIDMVPFVTWVSVVPPLPLLALSLVIEGPERVVHALQNPTPIGVASVLFLGFVATTMGFAGWGFLIRRYGASAVSPFALLVPVFGTLSSWLILDEHFSNTRLAGMALILLGLAILLNIARFGSSDRLRAGLAK